MTGAAHQLAQKVGFVPLPSAMSAPIRFKQGHLDGLCGAYALINAFSHMSRGELFPQQMANPRDPELYHHVFDHAAAEVLFARLMGGLMRRKLPSLRHIPAKNRAEEVRSQTFDGTMLTEMMQALMPALRTFAKETGYKLTSSRPFSGREEKAFFRSDADELAKRNLIWQTLQGHCRLKRPRRVAIIGTSGKDHHWTVVCNADRERLYLWDSGAHQRKHINFSRTRYGYAGADTSRHYIEAGEILLLELNER